jgi:organizing structure protein 2
VYDTGVSAHKEMEHLIDRWVGIEGKIEKELVEIAPKNGESLLPGGIYVLVSGMAGSILARNRMLPLRLLTPVLTTILSAMYLLPETSSNVYAAIKRSEAQFPVVRDAHNEFSSSVTQGVKGLEDSLHVGRKKVEDAIETSRKNILGRDK